MKSIIEKGVIIVLFLLYIYTPIFKVFPISSKLILEAIGLVVSLVYLFSDSIRLRRSIIWIFSYAIVILIWDCIVCFINGENEFVLAKSLLTPIGSVFAAQLLFLCSRKYIKSHHDFLFYIVITVFIESVICVIMKFVPQVYDLVDAIQIAQIGNADIDIEDITSYYRFMGLGNAVYFGVLPSVSIGLIASVYEIQNEKNKGKLIFLYVAFVFISIVSFFVARTSLAIALVALVLLLFYKLREGVSKSIKTIIALSSLVFLVYVVIIAFFNEEMLNWGFAFFIDGNSSSNSDRTASIVQDWIINTHFDVDTFFFGDGRYTDSLGTGYYKGVDIGYYRRIFYGGIIGLLLMLYYHLKVVIFSYRCIKTPDIKWMSYALYTCYLLILVKGDALMLSHFILFLVFFQKGIFTTKTIVNSK